VKLELKKPESSVAAAKPATSISTNSKTSNQTAAQKENKPSSTTPFPEPFLLNFGNFSFLFLYLKFISVKLLNVQLDYFQERSFLMQKLNINDGNT
jgi:hypothetical protein